MPKDSTDTFILRFSYDHFHTDGKVENLVEALNVNDTDRVLLSLVNKGLDDDTLTPEELTDRIERLGKICRKLKRGGFFPEVVLPGLLPGVNGRAKLVDFLKNTYKQAAALKVPILWIDDMDCKAAKKGGHKESIAWYKSISQIVSKKSPKMRLGLIAAEPGTYVNNSVSPAELSRTIAKKRPLLAQSQGFTSDNCRSDVLNVARNLSISTIQIAADETFDFSGNITAPQASSFHKSAEATQMQANLNLLFGGRDMILDCFDQVGTAPRTENIYLKMVDHSEKFYDQLRKYLPERPTHGGVRIIIPEFDNDKNKLNATAFNNPWYKILWRMGIPVTTIRPSDISLDDPTNTVYILTGTTPLQLERDQLDAIFTNGVLLDALAADTICNTMKLPGLIGMKVGGPMKGVQQEIISYQAFAAANYAYNTTWGGVLEADDFRDLQPFHALAEQVTSLLQKGKKQPAGVGMVLFDNIDHNHRSAILPYSLTEENYGPMLCHQRQRHTVEIIQWLLRKRLPCFIENTPDLIPFYIPIQGKKRAILALLNIGFDWVIDARVRLGRLPFTLKRVRELSEQGDLSTPAHLQPITNGGYKYIQVTPECAVPPMQMSILFLE